MPSFTPNSIDLNTLSLPTNPPTNAGDVRFNGQEANLYLAYQRNLESAKALATANRFHDAWLLLNISVECFFKHIFVLMKPEFENHSTPIVKRPRGPIDYDGSFSFFHVSRDRNNWMPVRDFGHEVMELWSLLDRFTTANIDTHFQLLKNDIPTGTSWVKGRYSAPNPSFKNRYQNYIKNFENSLNSVFVRFK